MNSYLLTMSIIALLKNSNHQFFSLQIKCIKPLEGFEKTFEKIEISDYISDLFNIEAKMQKLQAKKDNYGSPLFDSGETETSQQR